MNAHKILARNGNNFLVESNSINKSYARGPVGYIVRNGQIVAEGQIKYLKKKWSEWNG